MRKCSVYIATSLDGYIARPDGGLDWLTKYPITPETNYGYDEFYASIDTVVMGGRTYRELLNMDIPWMYKGKKTYVVTHNAVKTDENIEFITDNIINRIVELRKEIGKNIWIIGGGELITLLLNTGLVDELQICYVPVILGNGIPLFPNNPKESAWELIGSTAYDSGIIKLDYVIQR